MRRRLYSVIRLFFLLQVVYLPDLSAARQPAYFLLGEEQFRGIQIYDVIQDNELNYLFATSEGLFYFDYYRYEKIECEQARNNAVFSFVRNNEGTVFCLNLSNQVFAIKNKICTLFYELQPGEGSADLSLAVTDNGNLAVVGRKVVILATDGHVIARQQSQNRYIGPALRGEKGELFFHIGLTDTLLQYASGKFTFHRLTLPPGMNKPSLLLFFHEAGQLAVLDNGTRKRYRFIQSTFTLEPLPANPVFEHSEKIKIYETGNLLWVAGALRGVALAAGPGADTSFLYEDYFISDVYRDHENNILLSTFDKGILVIPDMEVMDVIDAFRTDPVKSIYGEPGQPLLLGTSRGKLLQYDAGKLRVVYDQGRFPIEALHSTPGSDLVLFNDKRISAYHKSTGKVQAFTDGSLKDAAFTSENAFYIGTNIGLFHATFTPGRGFESHHLPGMTNRVYTLEYNPENKKLYASTSTGFKIVSPDGSIEKVTYAGADLSPAYLLYHAGRVYLNTRKNGILVMEDNRITDSIIPMIQGRRAQLKKFIIHDNTIIANESNGFYRFDMQGNLLHAIHAVFGGSSKRVIDFTFQGKQFWISHLGGVQQVDLNHTDSRNAVPVIRMSRIYCNDTLTAANLPGRFTSDQRKFRFVFSSPTLLNHQTIRYTWKLEGYDATWNSNAYENNEVTYNALGPGDYTFYVKAENQGVFSPAVTYSFHIASPFYTRWWFITLCILLFIGAVYVIYRWQLKIRQRKSQQINELNASKLIAIQSQMNPHFIFNSLNSIQDLILKGDTEQSYTYITTFSNLVRRTLSYSEKDFIDFEQELKLLELYLSLEKLRFKKDLHYELHAEDIEDIMLPPLLIQPFIENALVHGLLHKEGEKKLIIRFELKTDLVCIIEDNGIGREKAKTIRMRQRADHESFSGKAIRNRFEILSNVMDGTFGYTYEDLYHDGIACGTRVTLTIPVKHKF